MEEDAIMISSGSSKETSPEVPDSKTEENKEEEKDSANLSETVSEPESRTLTEQDSSMEEQNDSDVIRPPPMKRPRISLNNLDQLKHENDV